MGFSLFPVTGFPLWATIVLVGVDLLIRIVALGWIPNKRKPSVALGWLVAIFFIPYVGIIAFLLFGSAKAPRPRREKQTEINRYIRELSGGGAIAADADDLPEYVRTAAQLNYTLGTLPLLGGNSFELLPDSHQCMRLMAADVDRAQEYVHFEFYIVSLDPATKDLIEALLRAHQRGVKVRILIDHVGSLGYPGYKELVRLLDSAGVPWRRMLPVRPWRLEYQRPDLRNHRKLLVVDGACAYTGSQNIIHRSYNKPGNLRRGLEWLDLMVRTEGPIVAALNAVFITDWYSETEQILFDEFDTRLPEELSADGISQVVPSGPGFELENNLRLFNHLIYNANERIVICSPYFVPDESIMHALTTAALSGVEVRLYVGETGDHTITHLAQCSFYEELMRAKVRIFLYHAPVVLHSKFILVDDDVAVIGSSNMDERSFAMNFEISLMIADEGFVSRMYQLEESDYRPNCEELTLERWVSRPLAKRYFENVARLTSALL